MGQVHRVPRPDRRRDPAQPALDRAPGRLRLRHHLRHEQRVRLRLPARQHGVVAEDLVQRGHNFAIVDEVDSILIDEARTPLIISGPAEQSARWYSEFARVVDRLVRASEGEGDYEVDESKRTIAVDRARRRQGRGPARHRQPVRVGEHPAGRLPQQRASRPRSSTSATRTTSSTTARSSSSTSSPAASCTAAGTTRACTRPSRPRRAWRSSRRTRPSPRSPCRTTSGCTRSCPA